MDNPNAANKFFRSGRGTHFYDFFPTETQGVNRYMFWRSRCHNCNRIGHNSSHCDQSQVCVYCSGSGHNAETCQDRLSALNILYKRGYVNERIDPKDEDALAKDIPIDFVPQPDRFAVPRSRQTDYRTFSMCVRESDMASSPSKLYQLSLCNSASVSVNDLQNIDNRSNNLGSASGHSRDSTSSTIPQLHSDNRSSIDDIEDVDVFGSSQPKKSLSFSAPDYIPISEMMSEQISLAEDCDGDGDNDENDDGHGTQSDLAKRKLKEVDRRLRVIEVEEQRQQELKELLKMERDIVLKRLKFEKKYNKK